MKKVQFIKDILMAFWFGWFALAGVVVTALFIWLTSYKMNFDDIVLAGSFVGIILGGITALSLFLLAWRKYGSSFRGEYNVMKLLKQAFS